MWKDAETRPPPLRAGYLISQDQPSYLVAGGAVVTVVAAMLVPLAERCWQRGRRILAALLLAALVPALSLVFSAAVERTRGARDEANRNRQASQSVSG